MSKRFVYDYYTVSVPGDLSDSMEELGQQAIREAEERTKLYCIPCQWSAEPIKGEIGSYKVLFLVRRKRNKSQAIPY